MTTPPPPPDPASLLAWYDANARVLPWRVAPQGGRVAPDPYAVWLSEIMLQQTTVATVGPYFRRFLALWPTVADLAAAPLDAVLAEWAGLGYYARARNLHACARAVVARHGGRFPADEAALLDLPGIGAYTAAAIAAIAFDQPAAAVDGNVERVMARYHAVTTPLPAAKPVLRALAAAAVPVDRPGDYTQALFDLGATVCVPRTPRCGDCPWAAGCRARALGIAADLPGKAAKAVKPIRRGVALWLVNPAGEVWLRRRPDSGLLGGMIEVPSSPWTPVAEGAAVALGEAAYRAALAAAPLPHLRWTRLPGTVRHTFTHFHLDLTVAWARLETGREMGQETGGPDGPGGIWRAPDALAGLALPTVMMKVVRHALAELAAEGAAPRLL